MKDIELTGFKKFLYYLGWFFVIFVSGWALWVILLILHYKDRKKPKEKGKLTKSYQKFIYILGWIGLFIIVMGVAIFLAAIVAVLLE